MIFGPKNISDEAPTPQRIKESPININSAFDFSKRSKRETIKPKIKELNEKSLQEPNFFSNSFSIPHFFIQKLKGTALMKSIPSIKRTNLVSLMGDKAYNIPEKKNGIFKRFSLIFDEYFQQSIISPDHPCKMTWNVFCIVYLAFCFLYIPMKFSFNLEWEFDYLLEFLTALVFLMDIFLNFITGDFVKGFLVMKPKILCKNYLKGLFFFDLLGFIFSLLEIKNIDNDLSPQFRSLLLYKFFILAKFPRFFNYTRIVLNHMKSVYKYQKLIDLIKLICYSLFLAHIMACFWHLCSNINPQKNWLVFYKLQDEGPATHYIYSFYWTILTIMTVGYGDIVPQNEYETLFATIAIIFGCGLYAFNLNSIGIILQNNKKKENKFKNNLIIIKNFMDRKNIDIKLQRRVQEYLNFMWSEQQNHNYDEEIEIIKKLNETLKEELLLESYGGIFLNSPLFVKNFSEKCCRKIVKIIKEVKFIPGDEIFEEGLFDDCSLYYINSGSVGIYLNTFDQNDNNFLKVCKKGEIFGDFSFFTRNPREFSCKSIDFTSVLIINQAKALQIFKENEEDYERYCMIKDQILLENNYSLLKHRCFYCRSLTHTIKDCNFLHYIPDIEKIIKRHDFYKEEPRRTFSRKSHPRFLKIKIKRDALKIQKTQENFKLNCTNIWTSRAQNTDWLLPVDTLDSSDLEDSNALDPTYLERNLCKEEEKEFINYIDNDLNEYNQYNQLLLKNASSTLIVPQPKFESIHTMEKNTKETFLNINDEGKNDNFQSSFEKLKNFKNYYPKTNCSRIIQNIRKIKYMNKRMADMINKQKEKKLGVEIFNKIQKMKKYSIYFEKYKDLIIKSFVTKFKIKSPKRNQDDSENHAASEKKRNKSFIGFFDKKKMFSEKSFASLVTTLLQKPKISIPITRKTIKLQKPSSENKKNCV